MLKSVRFSLARAEDPVPFSHFINLDGNVAAFQMFDEVEQIHIGVICNDKLPTNEQMEQILVMCRQAVAMNEMVSIHFAAGTAIFEPWVDTVARD